MQLQGRLFGFNYTSLMWCAGFLLMSLMASHWVSVDSDLVLHILYGRALIEAGLPVADPLLSGATEAPILQEWLFEALVAWLDRSFGLAGPLLLSSILMGSLMAGLFRRTRDQGACLWMALLYAIFVLFTLRIHLIIRPHLVSWAAVVLLAMLLEDWQSGRRGFAATLWPGAALMLIWANMHGGFLIGLALTGVFALQSGYEALASKKIEKLLQATALVAVFSLVTLLNPWGWHLHVHLITFLGNDFLMSSTTDFLPPQADNGSLPVLLLALVAVLVPLLLTWRQVVLRDWVLLAGLFYAALTSARNIPFFGLVMLPVAVSYLQRWLEFSGNRFGTVVLESSGRLEEDEGSHNGVGWPLLILCGTTLLLATGSIRVGLHSYNVPESAIAWVNDQPELLEIPVFADYMFAGYLLYATPVERVYLHALNANYPPLRLENYFNVESGEPGWETALEGLGWAMVRAEEGHAKTFTESPCWQGVYADENAEVFKRLCPLSDQGLLEGATAQ